MGFLHSFLNNCLKHNQRRHGKKDYNELVAMRLMAVQLCYESLERQPHNANMVGSTYILVQAKLREFFGKF